jgi:hypothetical protein
LGPPHPTAASMPYWRFIQFLQFLNPFSPQNLSISSSFFSRGRRKKEGEKEGEY